MSGKSFRVSDGDWICPDKKCGNVNFARRTSCNRCGREKTTEAKMMKAGGTEIGKTLAEKSRGLFSANDWQCKTCGNVNWARRSECNMCNTPKYAKLEERTGYGGGFNERENVEYIEREESDGEYDEFGRKKKKYRGKTNSTSSSKESEKKEDDDEEDEDGDLSKYDLDASDDDEDKAAKKKGSRSGSSRSRSSSRSSSSSSRSRSRDDSGRFFKFNLHASGMYSVLQAANKWNNVPLNTEVLRCASYSQCYDSDTKQNWSHSPSDHDVWTKVVHPLTDMLQTYHLPVAHYPKNAIKRKSSGNTSPPLQLIFGLVSPHTQHHGQGLPILIHIKQSHCPIMIFLESCANSGSVQSVALKSPFHIIS
ncbi:zinc finger protein [Collichthys lucidus]|uniref:Zinc finger Ran-binding domain-containing protein 2 n=1 Tax=Collichthys lucidus TaxID=240159 RepID=A0A4U5UMD1_COLLU|nr:zinc finger protein [Collichthys lucidus]